MRYTNMRSVLTRAALALSLTVAVAAVTVAQPPRPAQPVYGVDDMLTTTNINVADLSDDGRWIAATVSSLTDRIGIDNHRFGDPTYIAPGVAEVWVIDTQTSKVHKVFNEKRQVRGLKWSPDGNRLVMLLLNAEVIEPVIWDRSTGKLANIKLPAGKPVADNAKLEWSPDGQEVLLAVRAADWRKTASDRFRNLTTASTVVLSSKDPFLAWEDLRRMSVVRSLITYNVASGQIRELIAESKLGAYDIAEDGTFVTYAEDMAKKTDYDGGSDNQVHLVPTAGGERRTIIKSTKGLNIQWSLDRRRYGYAKDGNIFVASVDDKEPRQITGKKPEKTETVAEKTKEGGVKDAEKEKKEKENARFNLLRMSPRGDRLVASNKEGWWLIDTASGEKDLFLKVPEEDKEAPRYQILDWNPTTDSIYMGYSARTKWERGLVRYDPRAKRMEDVFKDSRLYSGFRFSKSGETVIFSSADGNRTGDLYAADGDMKNIRRLTNLNPSLAGKRLSRTELVNYLDADGNKTYGVLYYPAEYEQGTKYPTVFNIYEQFFDDNFNGTINVLTSNGYAVMQPSVMLEQGYPGEAWVKGVTSAANKLIEMGVADPERLGVQGTSYGGYATNLLITQTNRFKAAINISGKVNMISFYTDSPRLGIRNIHAPEKSQDRIGATLWQQPQKYIQHSAIMFADRIKTPLLLMTGEQDHNVPARQAMEMYYALRRLGREVEWVSYTNGGHGMPTTTVDEVRDYHERIIRWYDDHLKGDLKKKAEERKAEVP